MKNLKKIQLLLLCLFTLALALPSNAAVQSMTAAVDAQSNGFKIGKKVVVTCRGGRGKYEILQKENENRWCDINFGDVCATRKVVAAQRVCVASYHRRVVLKNRKDAKDALKLENTPDTVKPNDTADVAALRKELIEIEKKRLDIAKKVLELKRRELQLQNDV